MSRYDSCRPLTIGDHFKGLKDVGDMLAGTKTDRPSISDYARGLEMQGRMTPAVREALEKAKRIRDTSEVVFYIAGPLTGMSEETKARYGQVSDHLSQYGPVQGRGDQTELFFGYVPHLHGTDPIKHPNVTANEVRDIDYLFARVIADFHINFTDPTAHGNAIEEGWGETAMVPTIYLTPTEQKLSRLTAGMNNIVTTIRYDEFATDGMEQLRLTTDEIAAWKRFFPQRDPREFYYLSDSYLRDVVLRLNGGDPGKFSPVFDVRQYAMYVRDGGDPRYGQVGRLEAHDWRESGNLHVLFPDGDTVYYPDNGGQLSWWPIIEQKDEKDDNGDIEYAA